MNRRAKLEEWWNLLHSTDEFTDTIGLLSKFCKEWGCTYTVIQAIEGDPACSIWFMGTAVCESADTADKAIHLTLKKAVVMLRNSPANRVRHNVVNIDVLIEADMDLSGFVVKAKEALRPYVSGFKISFGGVKYGTDDYEY